MFSLELNIFEKLTQFSKTLKGGDRKSHKISSHRSLATKFYQHTDSIKINRPGHNIHIVRIYLLYLVTRNVPLSRGFTLFLPIFTSSAGMDLVLRKIST